MTANQLVAMGFPLLTAAAVGITGLFIRRPWAERSDEDVEAGVVEVDQSASNIQGIAALDEAARLIRSAQQQIQRARMPADNITTPN
jgi:hypothetical protein